ncbi:TOMM precursor leader peptide-binding protein [Halorubraceae archaeon YAN]|nr:TOMM precursor leader peptide-binding protein [Halorubraceae archaeon YAN]
MTENTTETETQAEAAEPTLNPDETPTFNPAVTAVQVDNNTLHVRSGPWGGPAITIRDTDGDGLLGQLLDRIDGDRTVAEVCERFESAQQMEIKQLLSSLTESNVLTTESPTETQSHLALKYQFQQNERERLGEKSVLIVACDRMGRSIATDLLEMGVGSIDVTQPYTDPIDNTATIEDDRLTYHDDPALLPLIESADLVVYTASRQRPLISDLNELAVETDTPLLPVQIHGFDGIVGPAVFPNETACYTCFVERTRANVVDPDGYEAYRSTLDADNRLSTASLPAFSRMLAGFAAMELLHLLAYGTGYTAGRVVTIDSLELSMEANDVLTLPRCECCGVPAGADVQRFVSMEDVVHAGKLNDENAEHGTSHQSHALTDEVSAE